MSSRPTLCLLPGLLCDATVWGPQIEAFGGGAEIRIPDFWGQSSFEEMARRTLAETTGPLSVVGHSMGGRVALEMWRLEPGRIERLALLDTGFHGPLPQEEPQRMALVRVAYEKGMAAVADRWLPHMVHPRRLHDPSIMEPLRAMVTRATPRIFEGQQRAGLTRPDATAYLPKIACPTLIVCGLQDEWSPPDRHVEMARRMPGSRLELIDDCGHMVSVEQPEALNDALRAWLAMPVVEAA
jgi:pimeloyl-ACP methyl ester carboxylesterase